MSPSTVPVVNVYGGDTFDQTYLFKAGTPPVAINFVTEGWSNWLCECKPHDDTDAVFPITVDVSQASTGRITLTGTAAQTADFRSGTFDLQASKGATVKTWIRGTIEWTEDISR
jgi:hypothetical protein